MARQFAEIRTNLGLSLNEQAKSLHPNIEIIFLTLEPEYKLENGSIEKKFKLEETRINLSLEHIKSVIEQFSFIQKNLEAFNKIAETVNVIIEDKPTPPHAE